MNAPSPGVIALFQPNEFYGTLDEYLDALADAMKTEYEGIVNAGFQLQIDAPDLAMGRHIMYRDQPDEVFVEATARHVAAINRALADVPGDQVRLHVCWGNYEGPHHLDIPVEAIMEHILEAKPATILFEAANPRHAHEWTAWRDAADPRRQDPRAGRHLLDLQLHRAPRAHRAAASRRSPRSSAPSASWRAPTAASARGRASGRSTRRSAGRSSRPFPRARRSRRAVCTRRRQRTEATTSPPYSRSR